MAEDVLTIVRAIPPSSPTCVRELFVLFATAPDIHKAMDRHFIRERFSNLIQSVGVTYIRNHLIYIEELWHRIDRGYASKNWLMPMRESGLYLLLG